MSLLAGSAGMVIDSFEELGQNLAVLVATETTADGRTTTALVEMGSVSGVMLRASVKDIEAYQKRRVTHTVEIHGSPEVTTRDQLALGGRTFLIVDVLHPVEISDWTRLILEEVV